MADLPSPFDVDQLRRQAKELRALARTGDRVARERIRRTHPRFGRSRPTDDDVAAFTLRDAQLCIARELGFEGWRDVLAHAQGEPDVGRPWRRWPDWPAGGLYQRAAKVAREAGARHVGPEHALGALLRPEGPSIASEVLVEVGITWDAWSELHRRVADDGPERGTGLFFSPAWNRFIGFAEGIALADGVEQVGDEHALLALAYHRSGQGPDSLLDLVELGADPDAVVTALGRRGVAVSDLRPPPVAPEPKRQGPRVYFPGDEYSTVTRALAERFPPGSAFWGWNTDGQGAYWVDGDADLSLDEVVRSLVKDPAAVEVVPFEQALERDRQRRAAGR